MLIIILILTSYLNVCFRWNQSWNLYIILIYGFAGILLIILYIRINYVMKNFHWYEYERTKKAHRGFLIGSIVSLLMWLSFFIFFYTEDDVFNL